MKEFGYGEEYKYAHDYSNNLPPRISSRCHNKKHLFMFREIIQEKIPLGNFKTVER
jgi:replication-associated recombination protein RarA